MRYAAMTGWGMHVPEQVLTNHDLATMVETSDEWIMTRTGIRERRLAGATETATSMATSAAQAALQRSGVRPDSIDLIIVGTFTPDQYMPSIACTVQHQLGAVRAAAFDLNAACTSFMYAMITATQFIQTGLYATVLVVGVDINSRFIDYTDRGTCVLFGDGAGAVVLQASDEPAGLLSSVLGADGSAGGVLTLGDGSALAALNGDAIVPRPFMKMNGQEVFRFAVKVMGEAAAEAVERAGLTFADVDALIPHQANQRIIDSASRRLDLPREKVWMNVERYGNTSSASVPICLVEAYESGFVRDGMNVVVVAFGGGLTWAAGVLRWGPGSVGREQRV